MVKKSNQNATSRIKPMTTRKEDMDYVGDEDNDGYEDDLDDTDTPFEDELDGENTEEDFDLGGEEDDDQDDDVGDTDDDEKLGEDDDMDLDDMGLDDEDYDTGDDDDEDDGYAADDDDDDEEGDDDDMYGDDDEEDDDDDMDDDDEDGDEDAQLESLSRKVSLRDLREEVEDLGDKSSKLLKKLDDKSVSPALAKEMLSTLVGYLGGAMDLYTDLEKYAAKSDYENKDLTAYPYKA